MYPTVLILHSVTRWVVVALLALALVRAFTGKEAPWSAADEVPRQWLPHAMTLQLVLGLALWLALSPLIASARQDMSATMKDPALRFFTVEHFTVMLIALALVHIGAARTRRLSTPAAKRRTMLTFFGIATLLIAWGVPWDSRPLLRLSAPAPVVAVDTATT